MSISSIKKALKNVFQGVLKNLVSLADDSTLDNHLKPLKVGDKSTPIELSESELKVTGTINAADVNIADDVSIAATKKLYLDGGTDTYITESDSDVVDIYVGGDKLITMKEAGNSGNYIEFSHTVGFTQVTPTYDATDTEVYFSNEGQKQFLTFGSGNIADLNLYFPAVSGNFVLLIKQDGTGSRTVAADGWLAFDSGGSAAAGSSIILWPGGTEPTLTTDANAVDIVSFYWDSTNEIAYGVISLDFK